MKRLLATTAIVTAMAFAGAAMAEPDPEELEDEEVEVGAGAGGDILAGGEPLANTLLQQILNQVDDVTISMLNAAENLANLNASITIDAVEPEALLAALRSGVAALDDEGDPLFDIEGLLKGVSIVNTGTIAVDFFDPAQLAASLRTSSSELATTVIGALNTGVIGETGTAGQISPTLLNLANAATESVAQTSTSLASSAVYNDIPGIQLANVAQNAANSLDGSINVSQLLAQVAGASTTMIGALNTGDIATSITANASNLTQAIVGGGAPATTTP